MSMPLYLRGVDRERAERLARMFMHGYQPPIECAHRPGRMERRLGGVRGLFQECLDCGLVLGVVR